MMHPHREHIELPCIYEVAVPNPDWHINNTPKQVLSLQLAQMLIKAFMMPYFRLHNTEYLASVVRQIEVVVLGRNFKPRTNPILNNHQGSSRTNDIQKAVTNELTVITEKVKGLRKALLDKDKYDKIKNNERNLKIKTNMNNANDRRAFRSRNKSKNKRLYIETGK